MGEWCDDLANRYPWTGEALRSVPGPMCPKIDAALKNERGSCWSRPTDLPRRRPRMVDLEGGVLYVAIGSVWRNAMQDKGGWWWSSTSTAQTPIAAIEAAIRAEQDEARATLARLAVWRVDQPEAVGAAGVVLL